MHAGRACRVTSLISGFALLIALSTAPRGSRAFVTTSLSRSDAAGWSAGSPSLLPRGNGLLAFRSDRTGDNEIFTMNPDGSDQLDITNDASSDTDPAWSADGTKLAFTSNRTGNNDIFTMNPGGSGLADLTNTPASESQPAWSPDGTEIAYMLRRRGNDEICVINADGTHRRNLTKNPASDSDPAWSADGAHIAFTSDRTGNREVFVMGVDGSDVTDLTNNAAPDSQPAWSPDETEIAFTTFRGGSSEVYVMAADGTSQTDLSNDPGWDGEPAFSPDQGTRITFTTRRGGDNEVYMMNSMDGSDPLNVTHGVGSDSSPDWQPLPAGPPDGSPVQHVVIIDMENHTFDNVLGKLCVQTGRCDGATRGQLHDGTWIDLGPAEDIVPVVSHEPRAQDKAVNGGLMNGFDNIFGCTQQWAYACYTQFSQPQIPNLWALAATFAVSDRTFEESLIGSWGSHLELAAAGLDGFNGVSPHGQSGPGWGCDSGDTADWQPTQWDVATKQPSCVPQTDGSGPFRASRVPWVSTIMDRMDQNGLTWKIYGGVPFEEGLGYHLSICPAFAECLYGQQNVNFVQRDEFVTDAEAGTLPNLSIITPAEADSQHNNDSMLQGDNWIAGEVQALMAGPQWGSTALFVTYDDCGCFYDHVPPPAGLGIRIPMVIISPFAKLAFTDSNVASFTSLLAFVEHTFGLAPLSSGDAEAYDYADSFDYTQRPLPPIHLAVHPLRAWEREWLRAHPPDPQDST